MIDIAREAARVRHPLLALSACAWGVLAAGPGLHMPGTGVSCSAIGGFASSTVASLPIVLALNPPSALAAAWALMVVAMMSPLIIPALHHVRFTSLTRRRARSILLFVLGYGSVWMACGVLLTVVAAVALVAAPGSYGPAVTAALAAGIWQASPFKQRCLNRCHDTPPLRAFGPEADLDALRFGWMQGVWCAGSCGALMLIPMVLPRDHLMAMAAVAILAFCERLEDLEAPSWKMRGLGRATRMIAARLRIRWRMRRCRRVQAYRLAALTASCAAKARP